MSFVRLKSRQGDSRSEGADPGEAGRVYENLANGMHAMAQPLTVLRSAVAASTMPGVKAEARQFYLNASAEQVERVCALFREIQEILAAVQNPAECEPIDLSELLAYVAEVQKDLCGTSGVEIKIAGPQSPQLLVGDKQRTLQALLGILKIAVSLSGSGETIEVLTAFHFDGAELTVLNHSPQARNLTPLEQLSLSLAETKIRSQKGNYELFQNPFRVSLKLPIPETSSLEDEETLKGACNSRVH